MPQFEDLDVDPNDEEEKLEAFQLFSRQMLLMALFENEEQDFSVFDEETETDFESDTDETEEDARQQKTTRAFSRYLFEQMAEDFPDPDDLTVEEWSELAEEMTAPAAPQQNLPALAQRIYRLLKQELIVERERQTRYNPW